MFIPVILWSNMSQAAYKSQDVFHHIEMMGRESLVYELHISLHCISKLQTMKYLFISWLLDSNGSQTFMNGMTSANNWWDVDSLWAPKIVWAVSHGNLPIKITMVPQTMQCNNTQFHHVFLNCWWMKWALLTIDQIVKCFMSIQDSLSRFHGYLPTKIVSSADRHVCVRPTDQFFSLLIALSKCEASWLSTQFATGR